MQSSTTLACFRALVCFAVLASVNGLICLSSFCPNGDQPCNDYCEDPDDVCHLVSHSLDLQDFSTIEMGCSHNTDCSSECVLEPTGIGNVHYCCCTKDFCNHVPEETDHLTPSLGISTVAPTGIIPTLLNYTVCEEYRCNANENSCFHGYKVCPVEEGGVAPYCSSSYIINEDGKLEPLVKGCEYEVIPECYNNTLCHVDNPLNGVEHDFYMCCCNSSLCNLNETFTHPTQHVHYGKNECEALGCHHSCLIQDNEPHCVCRDGYALDESSNCIDINECALMWVSCDTSTEVCVNEEGGYQCACTTGYYFDQFLLACLPDDGIICERYECANVSMPSTCINTVEHCALTADHESIKDPKYHYCQSTFELVEGELIRRFSTCLHGGHTDCNNDDCQLRPSSDGDHYFCCCYGDLCNSNMRVEFPVQLNSTSQYITITTTTANGTSLGVNSRPNVSDQLVAPEAIGITVTLLAAVLIIVLIITVVFIYRYFQRPKQYKYTDDIDTHPQHNMSRLLTSTPVLDDLIGQGRFAKVYRITLNGQQVAIKTFNSTFQDSWNREKEIYSTSELSHANILHFLDADRRMLEGADAFCLIFEYQPNGSLYDYLQHCTVSLKEFSTLSQSAASGLAHLHSEISQGSVVKKPAIAHRDLKSKNILVKSDMTSCISDFGLAIKLNQGEHPNDAQGQVGTSRYMAPEVLEGAISFHQESFLRIDVYAFGLVLWEMASRCDIPGNSVSEYRPPFDNIVSPNPSIGEMRAIVAESQKRPEIPRGFRNNLDYEAVADTITESWDPDAEARPSAQLIETRLNKFADAIDPIKLKDTHPSHLPINLPPSDNPLPLTPSSSPGVTMSPSDTKPIPPFTLPNQMYFTSSYQSVVDSGNMSDEGQDRDSSKQYSPSSGCSQKTQKPAAMAESLADSSFYVATMNRNGQLETSI